MSIGTGGIGGRLGRRSHGAFPRAVLLAYFLLPAAVLAVLAGAAVFGPARGPGPVAARLLAAEGAPPGWTPPRSVGAAGFEALDDPTEAGWWQSGAARLDRGGWALKLAARPGAAFGDRIALLNEAVASLRAGLARSPASVAGWDLLTKALARAGAPARQTVDAWRLSILIAPYATELTLPRLDWGLWLYPELDADGRDLLAREIRIAWEQDPASTARLAVRHQRLAETREAVADEPDGPERLDLLAKRLGQPPAAAPSAAAPPPPQPRSKGGERQR